MNLLITGVGSYLGQVVVSRLMRHNPFGRVFGIARKPPPMLGPVHYIGADVRQVDLGDLIVTDDVQVVLHLAWSEVDADAARDEIAVMRRLLDIAEPAGLRRVVVPSCDWVYAPSEAAVGEDAPRRTTEGLGRATQALVRGKLSIESAIDAWRPHAGGVEAVVLRMCPVVGPTRSRVFDAVLAQKRIVGPPAGDPCLQFLHAADAAEALIAAASKPGLGPIYNVAGDEPLRLSAVAGVLEASVVRPPGWFARPALSALARTGVVPFKPADAARLHLGVPMDTTRCKAELCPLRFSARQALAVWRVGTRAFVGRSLGHSPHTADPLGEA